MLKIRLQRIGRRNEPHFRVVVAEHTTGVKSNKFVEKVGTFNPKSKQTQLNAERIKYWLSVGAKPTDRVHNMLVKASIVSGSTVNVLPKKSPIVSEQKNNGNGGDENSNAENGGDGAGGGGGDASDEDSDASNT